jgi:putative acetyltransferase
MRAEQVDPIDERALELIRELDEEMLDRYPGMPVYGIDVENFAGSGGIFLLLHVGRMTPACGALRPLDEGQAEIRRMYVRPAFRGRGLARQLLADLERIAAESGVQVLRIGTGDRQPEALGLYRSAGYAEIPRYGDHTDNPHSFCLAKPLRTADESEFLQRFENCTLAEELWTHRAHVRMAWLHLTQAPRHEALDKIRSGILRYNTEVLGRRLQYHGTVTVAFTCIIADRIEPLETWREFEQHNAELFSHGMPVLMRYYSRQRLMSVEARRNFIEPDLQALPASA